MPAPDDRGLLLAIETATARTSVALLRDGELLDEECAPAGVPGAEALLPAIDALLARCRTPLARVRAFALSVGPGSFTGLRIGVATVKGLAFGSDRPVAAVPTLAALARAAGPGPGDMRVATLDAQRGQLYAAGYDDPECRTPALPEGLYGPAELLAALPSRCRIVGEADRRVGDALRAGLSPRQELETGPPRLPRARDVGRLGAAALARGEGLAAADLLPRYLRRAEAEARRLGRPTEPPPDPRRVL